MFKICIVVNDYYIILSLLVFTQMSNMPCFGCWIPYKIET